MMENSTEIIAFVLTAYGHIGKSKYLYFTIIIIWYALIVVANSVLLVVIWLDKGLHEPMYLFLCSLFCNEIFGSTSVFPCLMAQMLSETHQVSVFSCFIQIFCLYSSASVEFCSLAAMAYDRYVSICHPLHYHVIMSIGRVRTIIILVWLYSFFNFTISFSFTARLRFCGNLIDRAICDNYLLSKLACSVSIINNLFDIFYTFVSVIVPLIPISFSYVKIFIVCLKTSKQTKQRAISTCTPQIASLTNLVCGCIIYMAETRSEIIVKHVPKNLRIILSVYLLIFQPILSPVMYGLNLSKIRNACKRYILHRK